MRLERTKNTKKNIFFGFFNKIVTLFYPFVIRVIIIHEIGAEFLGLSSLFSSILQVLNLTELGFNSAIVFSMYKPIAEDDNDALGAILNFYRKVYFVIGLIMLVLGIIMLPFIPRMINGTIPTGTNVFLLYLLYLINTVISYVLFAYRTSLLNAYQRNDIISNINTAVFVCTYTLQLIVVMYTKNFYFYVLCSILATIAINVTTAVITRKLFPKIVCVGRISDVLRKDIGQKVKGLMISKVNAVSRNALDSIFLSMFLGLLETARYNNYYYIMSSVTGFLLIIYSALQGGVGNSVAMESQEKNYEDLGRMNFLYMWLSGWGTICLLCFYQPFTVLFFGYNMLFPMHIVVLFCLYFYVLKIGDVISLYSEANGLWWKMRFVAIAETVLNIFLNYFLGKRFGVTGIVLGTLISIILTTQLWGTFLVFRNYFTNYKVYSYFVVHVFYLFVTVCNSLICFLICMQMRIDGFIGFLLRGVVCFFVPNIIYIVTYRNTKIYKTTIPWFFASFRQAKDS